MKKPSTLGALAGTAVALVVLAAISVMLLNTDGANYKVLVAVWLWLLPVTGAFAGLGYGAGRIIEARFGARRSGEDGGMHADTR